MNLICHLIKTVWRQFRGWVILFWLALVADIALPFAVPPSEARTVLDGIVLGGQALLSALMIVRLIQADSLVGSNTGWKTRPIRGSQLCLAKSLWILLFLLAPFLLAQGVAWMAAGFPIRTSLQATLEWLLCAGLFFLMIATVSGWTRTVFSFLGVLGALFVGMILFSSLVAALHWRIIGGEPVDSPGIIASALIIGSLWLLIWLVVAWVSQGCWQRLNSSVTALCIGLMGGIAAIMFFRIDFVTRPSDSAAGLTLNVLEEDDSGAATVHEQILWSHFRVKGLGSNEVVAVRELQGAFQPEQGPEMYLKEPAGRSIEPFRSAQAGETFRVVKRFFPKDTLWFNTSRLDSSRFLPIHHASESGGTTGIRGNTGHLKGELELQRFEIKAQGRTSVKPGAIRLSSGTQLDFRKVESENGRLTIQVAERSPQLFLSPRTDRQTYVLVLHHEGSGEAYAYTSSVMAFGGSVGLPAERIMRLPVEFPYPTLRTQLTGISLEEWLSQARLWVFEAVPKDLATLSFEKQNYTWRVRHRRPLLASEGGQVDEVQISGMEAIRKAQLPENPSDEDLNAYLDTVLHNLPDRWDSSSRDLVTDKFHAIGGKGVHLLLQRYPLEPRIESMYLRSLLTRMVQAEHLPSLLDALRRDPELIWLVRQKGWDQEARSVALELIQSHRNPVPIDLLILAAEAKSRKSYPDLAWHYIHNQRGHYNATPVLLQCPGFDLQEPVDAAWKRARVGLANPTDLAGAAAMFGLPGALREAILAMENLSSSDRRRRDLTDTLLELTHYNGPREGFSKWLLEHAGQFSFDPARQHYLLVD